MKPIINYEGYDLYIEKDKYTTNGRIYLGLVTIDGELFDDITINLPDKELNNHEICLNSNLQNDIKNKLYETDVFINLSKEEQYNMGRYNIVQVNEALLKEYLYDNGKEVENEL